MQYRQARTMAGKGGAPDQFPAAIRALCFDRNDRLYAAGGLEVKVFEPGGGLAQHWNTSKRISAIAVAEDGSTWAGEAGLVEIFNRLGQLVHTWRVPGCLGEVTAIAFHKGEVLIADVQDRSIRRFDRTGKFLNTIGKENRTGGFLIPNAVLDFDVDADGIVHAANPGKHRVERYTMEGALLGHIGHFDGQNAAGFGGCCNPTNIALGSAGQVYVTEKAGARAKVLDAEGNLVAVISDSAFNPACKNMDIAVDSRGRVFVADTVTLHIMVFEPVAEAKS